jgi:hypothetical protein
MHQDTVRPVHKTVSSGIYWLGFDRIWCWTYTLRGLRLIPMYVEPTHWEAYVLFRSMLNLHTERPMSYSDVCWTYALRGLRLIPTYVEPTHWEAYVLFRRMLNLRTERPTSYSDVCWTYALRGLRLIPMYVEPTKLHIEKPTSSSDVSQSELYRFYPKTAYRLGNV